MVAASSDWPDRASHAGDALDAVRVWQVDLGDVAWLAERYGPALSSDEWERAARLRDAANRARFIGVRGWLRAVLASHLGQAAADLRFRYGPQGKPMLNSTNPPDLRFNLSHSGEIALVAVAFKREVGVDVERVREGKLRLAERFFAVDEVSRLRSLPADEQDRAFYRCWTRKEAFVKARGEGLSLPLNHFAVSVGPDEPPLLRWVQGDDREAARWSVHDLPSIPGYSSALVVEGAFTSLACARWRARLASQG